MDCQPSYRTPLRHASRSGAGGEDGGVGSVAGRFAGLASLVSVVSEEDKREQRIPFLILFLVIACFVVATGSTLIVLSLVEHLPKLIAFLETQPGQFCIALYAVISGIGAIVSLGRLMALTGEEEYRGRVLQVFCIDVLASLLWPLAFVWKCLSYAAYHTIRPLFQWFNGEERNYKLEYKKLKSEFKNFQKETAVNMKRLNEEHDKRIDTFQRWMQAKSEPLI